MSEEFYHGWLHVPKYKNYPKTKKPLLIGKASQKVCFQTTLPQLSGQHNFF